MALELTKGQKQAIEEYGKNIIISAGAGSGKTFVLTERVLHFIKNHGYHLNDFLILTFTNLAAGEMKERIRKKLTDNNLPDAAYVDNSDICTFDSYALSLVKKYHFLLGVSPKISIVDSNIISVRKRTIINDLFEELYKNKNEKFLTLIDRYCFNDDEEIRNLVFKLYNHSLNELDTNLYLDTFIEKYYNDDLIDGIINIYKNKLFEYIPVLKSLIMNLPDVPLKKGFDETYLDSVCSQFNELFNANTIEEFIKSIPDKISARAPRGLSTIDSENIELFKKEYRKLKTFIDKIPHSEELFKIHLQEAIPYAKILIELVKEVDLRLKNYKSNYQIYEFNDIAKLALDLVKSNMEVRNLLKSSLKMIMIDEYQDTSILQEAFINLIENDNVYMVGDVKQSIYRFRNAKCDIFIDKYNRYKYYNEGLAIDLNKNFRSRKEVLDDINYLFKNLMINEYGGASYIDDHLIEYGNSDFEEYGSLDTSSHSDFIIHNKRGMDATTTEAHIIARDIIDKINNHYQVFDGKSLRDVKFSDFCILMDRGSAFEEYYKVFSSYQIPLFIDNDENIKNTMIVKILTNLLKIVKAIFTKNYNTKEFKKAYVAVARSFLFNYSDNDIYKIVKNNLYTDTDILKTIEESLFNNSSLPLSMKIENLLFDLDIYNKCIKSGNVIKNEKYLDMFISLFKDMIKLDYTLDDFLLYLDNIDTYNLKITLSSTGSTVDSVKLMNIHKSKGLEFKIVYFSGLFKSFNLMEYKSDFGVSSKFGLILPPFNNDDENLLKVLNMELETKEQISESIRLFYVALTRTKEKMIFVLSSDEYDLIYSNYNIDSFYCYMKENNLNNLDIENKYKKIVSGFINKQINLDVFKMLLTAYNYKFNDEFDEFSIQEVEKLNAKYFINNVIYPVENKCLDFYIENYAKVNDVTNKYKNNHITIKDYINFMNLLDYNVDINYLNSNKLEDLEYSKLILNVRYNNSEKYNSIFIRKLLENYDDINEMLKYYKLYFYKNPNEDILFYFIQKFNDRQINNEELLKIVKYLGYNINISFDQYIDICSLIQLKDYSFNELMSDILKYEEKEPTRKFDFDQSLKLVFNDYLNRKINLFDFKEIINLFGFTFNKDFDESQHKENLNFTIDDIYKVIVDNKKYNLDYQHMKSFKSFVEPFINSYLFNKRFIDVNIIEPKLKVSLSNQEKESLVINEIKIYNEIISKFRASKKLEITSSKNNMEFGTNIHFLLEVIDFNNPNYEFINNDFYKSIIKDFLNSVLFKNIKYGKIYKEYEFFDSNTNTSGIIDLMIVYDSYIDIIDYKTKNITDESYLKQLSIYEKYISRVFNKKVNTYLYSLIDRTYKLCK